MALIYDVHGNLPALESVLEDADRAGVRQFLLGGDYALFGAWPAETVGALRELENATWIRGNVDRWCAHPDQAGDDELLQTAIADCRAVVDAAVVAELGRLPERTVSGRTLYCHASPVSDLESFHPDPREDDERLLTGFVERRVVFGHTHLQFRRTRPSGQELVNPGSTGLPMDGDVRAAYAVVHDDGALELRRVAYDHEASAAEVIERFGESEWAKRSARRLRQAQP